MTVKQRLKEYIKFKGISTREFCREVGLSETYVNSMRTSIQPDKLAKIAIKFPELSTAWLIAGEGEMLRPKEILPPVEKDVLINIGSDVFKDKLIEMFTKGEIFSAAVVWEQHTQIVQMRAKIETMCIENERLRSLLAQHGIKTQ
jgi:transcriptional regulator with XRE-family HTH domain